ncbi:FAD-binding oxidoreductase [Alicyclobacillaceae bacterium I2511]|nr:FAD-binding oxidoreductase [Alicyclobacillaceae bacterium I2511]
MNALQFIKSTTKARNLDCQFQQEDAYLYATTEQYAKQIEKEYHAYQRLNIPGALVDSIPFAVNVQNALVRREQGQFHPLRFLTALVDRMVKNGVPIYEGTTAIKVCQYPTD